jgi:hypothetical protein
MAYAMQIRQETHPQMQRTSQCSMVGYLIGFVMSCLFHKDYSILRTGSNALVFLTEVKSDDGAADEACHRNQTIDASKNATQKSSQHGGVYYSFGRRVTISFTIIIQYY